MCLLGGHPEVRALSLAGAAEPRAAGAVRPHPTGHGGPRTARQHRGARGAGRARRQASARPRVQGVVESPEIVTKV